MGKTASKAIPGLLCPEAGALKSTPPSGSRPPGIGHQRIHSLGNCRNSVAFADNFPSPRYTIPIAAKTASFRGAILVGRSQLLDAQNQPPGAANSFRLHTYRQPACFQSVRISIFANRMKTIRLFKGNAGGYAHAETTPACYARRPPVPRQGPARQTLLLLPHPPDIAAEIPPKSKKKSLYCAFPPPPASPPLAPFKVMNTILPGTTRDTLLFFRPQPSLGGGIPKRLSTCRQDKQESAT
jgi:hypothetical protein